MSGALEKYCHACGVPLDPRAVVCPECGVAQSYGQKNKIVAALLAFFLGGFGVHKFYLGRVGMGLLYLLFCWTFIPGPIALVEAVLYLIQSDEEFALKYG